MPDAWGQRKRRAVRIVKTHPVQCGVTAQHGTTNRLCLAWSRLLEDQTSTALLSSKLDETLSRSEGERSPPNIKKMPCSSPGDLRLIRLRVASNHMLWLRPPARPHLVDTRTKKRAVGFLAAFGLGALAALGLSVPLTAALGFAAFFTVCACTGGGVGAFRFLVRVSFFVSSFFASFATFAMVSATGTPSSRIVG